MLHIAVSFVNFESLKIEKWIFAPNQWQNSKVVAKKYLTIKTNRVNKATHPTDAAALAVELLLVLVIVQFALVAEIFPEQRAAAAAVLLHRLPQPAHAALDLRIK